MDAISLLKHQIDDSAYQLEKCLEGFPVESFDAKPIASGMSFREMVVHLLEVYHAAAKMAKGEKHEWGSYVAPELADEDLLSALTSLRATAVELLLAGGESGIQTASAFIVGHDYYHVGQLVTLRLAVQPDWDSYSIYNH